MRRSRSSCYARWRFLNSSNEASHILKPKAKLLFTAPSYVDQRPSNEDEAPSHDIQSPHAKLLYTTPSNVNQSLHCKHEASKQPINHASYANPWVSQTTRTPSMPSNADLSLLKPSNPDSFILIMPEHAHDQTNVNYVYRESWPRTQRNMSSGNAKINNRTRQI